MTKTCVICNEKIIEKKERWVRLTDFNKGKQVGETFYHLECWRDRFRISNSLRKQKMYKQAQKAIGQIVRAVNPNQQEVFEIKS
ncbi:unnamed protein product [marine sediment metagenome]|uniref:PARP-type domain-containing protein n=1 Tax=marine sediment metagenome TaxID=412755 RepID=X1CEX5_9ZZZZ